MIGIVTPYGRCETTMAAVQLADLALAHGHRVRLVSESPVVRGVHPLWDRLVRSSRGNGLYEAAKGCDRIIYFGFERTAKGMADVTAAKECRHILVPLPERINADNKLDALAYTEIVCSGRACRALLKTLLVDTGDLLPDKLEYVQWASGLPPMSREGLLADRTLSVVLVAESQVIDCCGAMLLRLVNELLNELPHLRMTLVSAKSWCRRDRHDLQQICRHWNGRLQISSAFSWPDLVKMFAVHDWALLPNLRSTFGMTTAAALACGIPVLAYAVPPWTELIQHERNGILMPCETRENRLGLPSASPMFTSTVECCVNAFADNRLLFRMQVNDWHVDQHQTVFDQFWSAKLD